MTRARVSILLAFVVGAATVPGCVSLKRTPEARFFVLRSLAASGAASPGPGATPSAGDPVGVLPVRVPGYLDRPQLVTWVAPGELRIDEFLRWAEPLDAGVARTLAANLEALLPGRRLVPWPWPASTPLSCRVRVEIQRFGPEAAGEIRLAGGWALLPASGERPLVSRPLDLRRAAPPGVGASSAAAAGVEGMSELLLDLAREIASAAGEMPR